MYRCAFITFALSFGRLLLLEVFGLTGFLSEVTLGFQLLVGAFLLVFKHSYR